MVVIMMMIMMIYRITITQPSHCVHRYVSAIYRRGKNKAVISVRVTEVGLFT
jgi:hypothetical protein